MNVVVVGGGLIGLSVAAECAAKNMSVTVLEGTAQERGASFGNAGMVVPSHFIPLAAPGMVALGLKWMWNPESPFYIQPRLDWELIRWGMQFYRSANRSHVARSEPLLRDLNMASRELYLELSKQSSFGLVEKGLVMLCKNPKTLDAEAHVAERAKELGIPAEVLSAQQMAQLDPDVEMDICGAIYFPKDCHLQPERFVRAQETRLQNSHAQLKWGCRALSFRVENNRIRAVVTSEGEIEGDEFVLASGAWSTELARSLHLRLPMQAGKGYSVTLTNPKQLPQICSIFTEARVAVTPMNGSLRFGGTMEIAGLNSNISKRRVQGIIRSVPQYYPQFQESDFEGIEPWYGLRPCSPDGLPYLGRPKSWNNLVIATGHAMMGLSLAPITGKLGGQLVARETPSIAIEQLNPDRFG
ncbi:MAG: FAD-dependent oxidoreductase [Pirellulales bacterium]